MRAPPPHWPRPRRPRASPQATRADRQRIKELERDLRRKERALAETAALLVLSKIVRWYNHEHRHSGIRYVTPAQRHDGDDHAILQARHTLYTQARERNPARWSRHTRDWSAVGAVTLNPERDCIVKAHSDGIDKQRLAA